MTAVSSTDPAPPRSPAASGRRPLAGQLARFVAVGVVSAIVDFGLLVALMNVAGLGHAPAKAASWVAGTATAYVLNSRWTFDGGGSGRRALAVTALYASTFAVQVGLFALAFPPLQASFGHTSAQVGGFVIAQGVATITNFAVQRVLIFAD